MSRIILPCPDNGRASDTPTTPNPIQIAHALSVLNAVQIAPGVWTAELSIGVTIRISDPRTAGPAALAEGMSDGN